MTSGLAALPRRRSTTAPWLAALVLLGACASAAAFGFDDVAARAQALARQPHVAATTPLPQELQGPRLRRLPRHPLRSGPCAVAQRGAAVRADVLPPRQVPDTAGGDQRDQRRRRARTSPSTAPDFDYGKNKAVAGRPGATSASPASASTTRSTTPAYKDELVVFLGASYFRALGAGQHYGLSARGLAIDTVGATGGQGEEFPRFTEFWIERPAHRPRRR